MRKHVTRRKGSSGRIDRYDIKYFQKLKTHHYRLSPRDSRYIKKVMLIMAENGRPYKGQRVKDAERQ